MGYERALNAPRSESTGALYGVNVNQQSAYSSRNLMNGGVGLSAHTGSFLVKARLSGLVGDDAKSTGISGNAAISYQF